MAAFTAFGAMGANEATNKPTTAIPKSNCHFLLIECNSFGVGSGVTAQLDSGAQSAMDLLFVK
jgi:hypothetical protein